MLEEIHLNSPDMLPPVDTPLLVGLHNGKVVGAKRTAYVSSRAQDLEYLLYDGEVVTGPFPWTYP